MPNISGPYILQTISTSLLNVWKFSFLTIKKIHLYMKYRLTPVNISEGGNHTVYKTT